MMVGRKLRRSVAEGEFITADAVEPPANSSLWRCGPNRTRCSGPRNLLSGAVTTPSTEVASMSTCASPFRPRILYGPDKRSTRPAPTPERVFQRSCRADQGAESPRRSPGASACLTRRASRPSTGLLWPNGRRSAQRRHPDNHATSFPATALSFAAVPSASMSSKV